MPRLLELSLNDHIPAFRLCLDWQVPVEENVHMKEVMSLSLSVPRLLELSLNDHIPAFRLCLDWQVPVEENVHMKEVMLHLAMSSLSNSETDCSTFIQ